MLSNLFAVLIRPFQDGASQSDVTAGTDELGLTAIRDLTSERREAVIAPTNEAEVDGGSSPIGLAFPRTVDTAAPIAPFSGAQNSGTRPRTVSELCDLYLRWTRGYFRTPEGYQQNCVKNIPPALRRLREAIGTEAPDSVTATMIRYTADQMAQSGLARITVNNYLNWIKSAFRWAAERDLISASTYATVNVVRPVQPGRTPAKEPRIRKPVEYAVVRATLPHLSPTIAAMVMVQWCTGARSSEVTQMRLRDIDRSETVWRYTVPTHKTRRFGKTRLVLIGPDAQEWLKPFITHRHPDDYIFQPKESYMEHVARRHCDRVTPLHRGNTIGTNRKARRRTFNKRFTAASYYLAIQRACDAAWPHPGGLSRLATRELSAAEKRKLREWQRQHRWHPHQLRRAAATRIRREVGVEAAKIILGHSDLRVTEIYAERDLRKAVEAMQLLG